MPVQNIPQTIYAPETLQKLNGIMDEAKDPTPEQVEHLANLNAAKNATGALSVEEQLKQMNVVPKTRPIQRDYPKVGRNDLCPCGSGKKYKNCCLASGKYETAHQVRRKN